MFLCFFRPCFAFPDCERRRSGGLGSWGWTGREKWSKRFASETHRNLLLGLQEAILPQADVRQIEDYADQLYEAREKEIVLWQTSRNIRRDDSWPPFEKVFVDFMGSS